ncbi:unnamed protein product [Spirodela intermedia]|uniref:AB hydrolase-1 domain-containing protein n=1 Tax=Spirodela intermedia TaxID=51605 RepID=A0A7I8J6X5_SPIIN|nr:unnamed protein product [Spirodela intermedia]CAA6665182.1 unnamed protein product [Spirodela intermedia]
MAPFSAALSHSPVPALIRFGGSSAPAHRLRLRAAGAQFGRPPSLRRANIRCGSSSSDSSRGAAVLAKPSGEPKTGSWAWRFEEQSVNVYYEEHGEAGTGSSKTVLMIPTISDVSTVEEWRAVARDIVGRGGETNWRAVIVDWPGLGYSDRPSLNYNADVMEDFLVAFLNTQNGPLSGAGEGPIIFGGGHAATIALRAAKKGLVKPSAVAAVPTWAGPAYRLRPRLQHGIQLSWDGCRYGLLRGTLRTPAVGWVMYSMLVSNEKAIQTQYTSHVYADASNVTEEIVKSRYELTKRKGARYVPAAFLTGELDPVASRRSSSRCSRRWKGESQRSERGQGVSKFVEVPGALLPHEEYPQEVAAQLYQFLEETFSSA